MGGVKTILLIAILLVWSSFASAQDSSTQALIGLLSPPAIKAIRSITPSLPLIITIDDPVTLGLVDSKARPEGNVTGTRLGGENALVGSSHLPAIFGFREFTVADGIMSYGASLPDVYRSSARMVDRILQGSSPGELPVEIPTRFELIVNLNAANSMGLIIPDTIIVQADEVI